jgi:hypothetical protein
VTAGTAGNVTAGARRFFTAGPRRGSPTLPLAPAHFISSAARDAVGFTLQGAGTGTDGAASFLSVTCRCWYLLRFNSSLMLR